MLHVRRSKPANWLTAAGVLRKLRAVELKGLPSFKNWRFLTMTLDPDLFGNCPLTGFLNARERIKTFTRDMQRAGLIHEDPRWCRKLEFHSNGWAHWHMLIDRTRRFSKKQLLQITKIWGLGRTNVEHIGGKRHGAGHAEAFMYTFKYAFKPAFVAGSGEDWDDEPQCAPGWFSNYREIVNGKPKTFSRTRFWQTSKGNFYLTVAPKKEEKPLTLEFKEWMASLTMEQLEHYSGTVTSYLPYTVSEIYYQFQKPAIVVIARRADGKYIKSGTVRLLTETALRYDVENGHRSLADGSPKTYNEFTELRRDLAVHEHRRDGQAIILDDENWFVAHLNLTTKIQELWKLQQLQRENKMTRPRAQSLSDCQLTLAKC